MSKSVKEIYQYILATVVVVGIFWIFKIIITDPIPPSNKDIAQIGIGIVFGAFSSVIGYFFGSSMGSKAKTDIIEKKEVDNGKK